MRARPRSGLLVFLAFVSAGIVAGITLVLLVRFRTHGTGLHARHFPAALAWLLVAWFPAIAAHEAGHLLFGAVMDMRPLLYGEIAMISGRTSPGATRMAIQRSLQKVARMMKSPA